MKDVFGATTALIFVGILCFTARAAKADDTIPTVTLSDAGPDRSIPVGSSFYLAGDADDTVSRLQPVFVRKSSPWIFGGQGPTCAALATSLGALKDGSGADVLTKMPTGLVGASAIWSGRAASGYATYISAPWTRPDAVTGKTTFKMLVEDQPTFFVAGGTFCMFVYQKTTSRSADATVIKSIVMASVRAQNACSNDAKKEGQELTDCRRTAEAKRKAAIAAAMQSLSKDEQTKLDAAINNAENASNELVDGPKRIRAIIRDWIPRDPAAPSQAIAHEVPIPLALDIRTSPLGRAVASLLLAHGTLVGPPANVYQTTGSVKQGVDTLSLFDDGQILLIEHKKVGMDATSKADVKTTDLVLPMSDDVTLRDVIELTKGRIRIAGAYLSAADLERMLQPILRADGKIAGDDATTFDAVVKRLHALDAEILRLLLRAPKVAGPLGVVGNGAAAEENLGAWVRDALVGCRVDQLKKWSIPGACRRDDAAGDNEDAIRSNREGWPGFRVGTSPIGFLERAMDDLERARAAWADDENALAIVTSVITAKQVTQPLEARVDITQDTWLFSYVTPTNAATISGANSLPVPNAAGATWAINVTLDAYAAQSLIVRIQP